MPERRGSRFVVEALFLAALTVAVALAHLDALEIVGAMAAGWLVVAIFEWVAWRGEPHYGSGLPPRYHLPRVELPPPQPLEQVVQGYPGSGRDDAPTWIASASLRAEVLGEWPRSPRPELDRDDEPEPAFATLTAKGADPWTIAAMPAAPIGDEAALPPPTGGGRRTAFYRLDPLGDPVPRRRFGRRGAVNQEGTVEVAAWPAARRRLPGAAGGA